MCWVDRRRQKQGDSQIEVEEVIAVGLQGELFWGMGVLGEYYIAMEYVCEMHNFLSWMCPRIFHW